MLVKDFMLFLVFVEPSVLPSWSVVSLLMEVWLPVLEIVVGS